MAGLCLLIESAHANMMFGGPPTGLSTKPDKKVPTLSGLSTYTHLFAFLIERLQALPEGE